MVSIGSTGCSYLGARFVSEKINKMLNVSSTRLFTLHSITVVSGAARQYSMGLRSKWRCKRYSMKQSTS